MDTFVTQQESWMDAPYPPAHATLLYPQSLTIGIYNNNNNNNPICKAPECQKTSVALVVLVSTKLGS